LLPWCVEASEVNTLGSDGSGFEGVDEFSGFLQVAGPWMKQTDKAC
jgi:hypothetical protein